MSYFRGVFRSETLQMNVHMACCLPDYEKPCNTLILLHGLSGGCDDWVRFTAIERYAREGGLAVFMPEVQRSWYTDMARGLPYFTFVSEELPKYIAETFRVPTDAERLYVAGLSMGGFGAMKCALTHPERYAGCVALSSRFYLRNKIKGLSDPTAKAEWEAILGASGKVKPQDDVEALAERAAKGKARPRFYLACGTEDALFPETERFQAVLKEHGFPVTYEKWPGIHDWKFWDAGIQKGLACVVRG